jgi:molecular chaperone GrpE
VTAGLDMVQRQLHEILAKHGVEPIKAHGHPFDPNLHDAVMQQPSHEHPEGTVVSELSRGYTIRERVLRPSKVAVSAKPAKE